MDEDLQRHLREHPGLRRSIWPDAKRIGTGLLVVAVVVVARFTVFRSEPTTAEKLERCGVPTIVGLLGADGGLLPSVGVLDVETVSALKWTSPCSGDAEYDYTVFVNGDVVDLAISRTAFGDDATVQLPAEILRSSDRLCFAVATTSAGKTGTVSADACYAVGTSS